MIELSQNGKYFKLFKTSDEYQLAENMEWYLNERNYSTIEKQIEDSYNYAVCKYAYDKYVELLSYAYNV